MELATKTFVVPTLWLCRRIPKLLSAINKLNDRKHGKLRRGAIQLVGLDATPLDNERTEVRVVTRRSPQRLVVPIAGTDGALKVQLYDHGNVGKVMKELTVASSKVKQWTI